eukprot:GHVQ01023640.1.p1 GENE.GHVQ01023640.1~~GHVQ01023640.1.p1  ORF type:complete len:446 (+),score=41.85 GHVQ01023640.1:139-1476(+)
MAGNNNNRRRNSRRSRTPSERRNNINYYDARRGPEEDRRIMREIRPRSMYCDLSEAGLVAFLQALLAYQVLSYSTISNIVHNNGWQFASRIAQYTMSVLYGSGMENAVNTAIPFSDARQERPVAVRNPAPRVANIAPMREPAPVRPPSQLAIQPTLRYLREFICSLDITSSDYTTFFQFLRNVTCMQDLYDLTDDVRFAYSKWCRGLIDASTTEHGGNPKPREIIPIILATKFNVPEAEIKNCRNWFPHLYKQFAGKARKVQIVCENLLAANGQSQGDGVSCSSSESGPTTSVSASSSSSSSGMQAQPAISPLGVTAVTNPIVTCATVDLTQTTTVAASNTSAPAATAAAITTSVSSSSSSSSSSRPENILNLRNRAVKREDDAGASNPAGLLRQVYGGRARANSSVSSNSLPASVRRNLDRQFRRDQEQKDQNKDPKKDDPPSK